ncbi:MAG: hypothetical protein JWM11_7363 [Planctomycetaceae bacterium]|nr:hypothetical protein [Planctomycetaceae bacterium]
MIERTLAAAEGQTRPHVEQAFFRGFDLACQSPFHRHGVGGDAVPQKKRNFKKRKRVRANLRLFIDH